MLSITIPKVEGYDDSKNEYVTILEETTIQLEHSLMAVSKWEQKWLKPFITEDEKSYEETVDYIRCMCMTSKVDQRVFEYLTDGNLHDVMEYINKPMTASIVTDRKKSHSKEFTTVETIYNSMFQLQIPLECEKWHLNRLLALIRYMAAKNSSGEKMSEEETLAYHQKINAENKARAIAARNAKR